MAKPVSNPVFTPAELALRAVQAYHRAAALTGSLYQLSDCAALPEALRPRYLAEIVLRSAAESRVAIALSGDMSSDPHAVATAVVAEIRRTWGQAVADDVMFRVAALQRGDMETARTGNINV